MRLLHIPHISDTSISCLWLSSEYVQLVKDYVAPDNVAIKVIVYLSLSSSKYSNKSSITKGCRPEFKLIFLIFTPANRTDETEKDIYSTGASADLLQLLCRYQHVFAHAYLQRFVRSTLSPRWWNRT